MRSLVFFLVIIFTEIKCQTVQIVAQSDTKYIGLSNKFEYLSPKTDTTQLFFTLTAKFITGLKTRDLNLLFDKIITIAKENGANLYRIKRYEIKDSANTLNLTIDMFYGREASIRENSEKDNPNEVYLLGYGKGDSKRSPLKIKVDKKTLQLKPGDYYKIILTENIATRINIGGFLGTTIWMEGRKNRPPAFLSLKGLGTGLGVNYITLKPAMTITTGKANYVPASFGHLLAILFKETH